MADPNPSFGRLTVSDFLDRLASAAPVPGGGSAAAIAGAMAAALLAMVARLSLDRPKYEPYRSTNERVLVAAEGSRESFLRLADQDAAAYAGYANALKLPRETEGQQQTRAAAIKAAARGAAEVPMATVRECAALIDEIGAVAGRSNLNAASDVEVAGRLCAAAARGAAANVQINLPMAGDERWSGEVMTELTTLLKQVDRVLAELNRRVAAGGLREPERA
jgi:formiminotetrahydrofolate cyclodeaminase